MDELYSILPDAVVKAIPPPDGKEFDISLWPSLFQKPVEDWEPLEDATNKDANGKLWIIYKKCFGNNTEDMYNLDYWIKLADDDGSSTAAHKWFNKFVHKSALASSGLVQKLIKEAVVTKGAGYVSSFLFNYTFNFASVLTYSFWSSMTSAAKDEGSAYRVFFGFDETLAKHLTTIFTPTVELALVMAAVFFSVVADDAQFETFQEQATRLTKKQASRLPEGPAPRRRQGLVDAVYDQAAKTVATVKGAAKRAFDGFASNPNSIFGSLEIKLTQQCYSRFYEREIQFKIECGALKASVRGDNQEMVILSDGIAIIDLRPTNFKPIKGTTPPRYSLTAVVAHAYGDTKDLISKEGIIQIKEALGPYVEGGDDYDSILIQPAEIRGKVLDEAKATHARWLQQIGKRMLRRQAAQLQVQCKQEPTASHMDSQYQESVHAVVEMLK